MTAVVVTLCAVTALLALLVVALLRSHAEILRQLHAIAGGAGVAGHELSTDGPAGFQTRPGVPLPRTGGSEATDISGVDLDGHGLAFGVIGQQHRTLVAFLSSGCLTCRSFWSAFTAPGTLQLRPDVRLVVVTKDPEDESVSEVVRLAPDEVPVVMSTKAWDDFEVPMAPYFVLVDGPSGHIIGEGASASWNQVRELMERALADSVVLRDLRSRGGATGRRDRDADIELLNAGIEPGDPRLSHPVHPDHDEVT